MNTLRRLSLQRFFQRNVSVLLIGGVASLILMLHAASHLPFVTDDTFISLRYSERLLNGKGLTWTDGPRVEGYSNLLWVLACAGLGALGVELLTAARVLGLVSMCAAVFAVVIAMKPRGAPGAMAAITAGCALALTGSLAVWSIGGLEQPFVALFLGCALAMVYPILIATPPEGLSQAEALALPDGRRRVLFASFFLGLLCLSRADGAVLCVAFALGLTLALGLRKATCLSVVRLSIFPALLTGAQLVFRYFYYHDIVPNTARVKVALTAHQRAGGIFYVRGGAASYLALLVPCALLLGVCLWSRGLRRRALFLTVLATTWLGYLILVGGDIFPARRQWIPALIPIAMLAGELARAAGLRLKRAQRVAPMLPVAILAMHAYSQRDAQEPENKRARDERWELEGKVIGELFHNAFFDKKATLAIDPAGAVPYYSRLEAIDMLGLNDRHIARHRPKSFGTGWAGHELGDGRYVLDRRPDLVVFLLPQGSERAAFPSGKQMEADRRFRSHYRLLRYEAPNDGSFPEERPARTVAWTRVDSPRIGFRREGDRMTIPGFLFAFHRLASAELDERGELVCRIRGSGRTGLERISLREGRYRVTADASREVSLDVWPSRDVSRGALYSGPIPGTFVIAGQAKVTVDLIVRAVSKGRPGVTDLRAVVLERVE